MHANNKRRHTRLCCDIPIELASKGAWVAATVTDVSRSGARIRIPGVPLGLERMARAARVAGRVADVLGVNFDARLHPERLGSLLSKRLRLVRIGQCDDRSPDVEVGCLLIPPLSDDEATMLGLGLPTLLADDSEGRACLPAHGPRARTDVGPSAASRAPGLGATRRHPAPSAGASSGGIGATNHVDWRAYVHASGARRSPPFVARAQSVSASGVRLRLPDRAMLHVDGGSDVAATMASLGNAYGAEVGLRLVAGTTHLWTGPARIQMVEVSHVSPHPVTLWLTYARPLRTAELRALDLGVSAE